MSDVDATLVARNSRYGDFTANARAAQRIKDAFRSVPGWGVLPDDQKESLDLIATKISRVLTGDCHYPDNWHDIAGYAKLAEDRCEP